MVTATDGDRGLFGEILYTLEAMDELDGNGQIMFFFVLTLRYIVCINFKSLEKFYTPYKIWMNLISCFIVFISLRFNFVMDSIKSRPSQSECFFTEMM